MEIKDLTPDIIEAMDESQMRCALKAEYARIQIQKAEALKAEQAEAERKAEGQKVVNEFFARKFANIRK